MQFGKETYQDIFKDFSGKTVGYLRNMGNWGDHLIEVGAMELFKAFNIKVVMVNPTYVSLDLMALSHVDTVFISGGGSLGKKYISNYELRTDLLKTFNGKTIILPQSMTDELDENTYTFTWLREVTSFQKKTGMKGICHDLAFFVNLDSYKQIKPKYLTGILLREEAESLSTHPLNLRDPVKLSNSLEDYIRLAANHEHIITDRLHFAIIAAKLGRRVSLVANNYYKIKAIYEFSMKFMTNVKFYNTANEAIAAELK